MSAPGLAFPELPAPEDFDGRVIITWPARRDGRELPGWGVSIHDAESGEQIFSVTRFGLVYANAADPVWLEAVCLADAEGRMVRDVSQVVAGEDGAAKTAAFRFLVTEMRVAEAAP